LPGRQGGVLNIDAPSVSWTDRYVTALRVNGQASQRAWVSQAQIAHGGALAYTVAATPGSWGTSAADAPPSVTSPTG
jgi:putative alpha-1,2-mannosidase